MARLLRWWQSLGDRRGRFRHPMRQSAYIEIDNGAARHGCMISDISESGARLMLPSHAHLPEEFTLLVPRRCRIVRRADGQVGVRFLDGDRTP